MVYAPFDVVVVVAVGGGDGANSIKNKDFNH